MPNGIKQRDLDKDITIERNNIEEELIKQASIYSWWLIQYEEARYKYEIAKVASDVLSENLYSAHRISLDKKGNRTTEKMVENAVKQDEKWIKSQEDLIEKKKYVGILQSAIKAMESKGMMLIQLTKFLKNDMDREVVEE